ncbi:MAG: MATE family efflux transporter [bacterium]|nr:MATE family efflux transporter [bacterium]
MTPADGSPAISLATPGAAVPTAVRHQVGRLAGPAIAEMLLMTLTHMVDMMMVGRLGPAAIAAVGICVQPMFLVLGLFQALAVGSTALVARAVGAGNQEEASAVTRQAVTSTVVMGAVAATLGVAIAPAVPRLMGAEPVVQAVAGNYFRIVMAPLPLMAMAFVLGAVLRGAGDTRTPMKVNALANVLNVAGNYVLIFGHLGFPALGVAGAAVATSVARCLASLILLGLILRGRLPVRFSLGDSFRPQLDLLRRLFKIGVPAAAEQLVMRGGQLMFVRIVASLGTTVLAAHQVAMSVESLAFMPAFGFGMAATTLVGQGLGAGRPAWSEKTAYETRRLGVLVMLGVGAGLFFFGKHIVSLYSDDGQVVAMGALALRIMALTQPFMAVNFITAGALRGAGDTRWPLYATAAGMWGVRLTVGYLLGVVAGFGLAGAWAGMAIDQATRATVLSLRFRAGRWKNITV